MTITDSGAMGHCPDNNRKGGAVMKIMKRGRIL